MFLKVKNIDDQQTLLNVADISAVVATEKGTDISMKNGDLHVTTMGIQSVVNRLGKLDLSIE